MAVCETWLKTDLKKPITVEELKGTFFSADQNANIIGVEVLDNGAAASLSGSVVGSVIRNDNATITVQNGTLTGNRASIVLPQAAYVVPGPLHIVIRLISGTVKTVLGACTGYVWRSTTDTITDPEHIVPSIDDLLALIDQMEDSKDACDAAAAKVTGLTADATTLSPGSSATASVTTENGHYKITLGIPQGAKGDTGSVADAWMLALGDEIAANTNLNTVTTIGNYRVKDATRAATLTNGPTTLAGYTLKVAKGQNDAMTLQIAISTDGAYVWTRRYYNSEWSSWVTFTTGFATSSVGGYMSATDKGVLDTSTVRGNKALSGITSLDGINTSGIYWLNSTNYPNGWPDAEGTGGKNALLVVFYDGGGARVQELTMYDGNGLNRRYCRMYINAQWYPWRQITTGAAVPWGLDLAPQIAANSNLNNFMTPGNYSSPGNITSTLVNAPPVSSSAFILKVMAGHLANTWVQMVIDVTGAAIFIRYYNTSTWNSWYKFSGTAV